ncbi:MAG: Zn-dependent hydrolase, partial [Lachnospiraceae bacterium]|nr:Zn-dependent hydrolase [Lachnospiraceae bacterium]
MNVNQERLFNHLQELAQIGMTDNGIYCMALSEEENEAHALAARYMEEAGMTTHVDAAGNMVGRYEGSDPNASVIMTGS